MNVLAGCAAVLGTVGAVAAQSTWHLRTGDGFARLVGDASSVSTCTAQPRPFVLPAGDYAVHFGTDALGKPLSLAFAVADGAAVSVAVTPAPAAVATIVPKDGAHWSTTTGGVAPANWHAPSTSARDPSDYRVDVSFAWGGPANDSVGVVARWIDDRQHYRFVWDRAAGELRLERQHGELTIVLARIAAPDRDDGSSPLERPEHTLALQVEGFRLTAFCDDALVLQALDGAFTAGACGVWWAGEDPAWREFSTEPPAAPRDSAAIVSAPGRATFHAATTATPGSFHVLELALDWPHPALPRTVAGLEPGLLRGPAAPRVLLADLRESLGPGGIGEVPVQGVIASTLQWPAATDLCGQMVLVRALIIAADGEAIVGRTPDVPLRF